jgi:hypothetical protein
MAPIYAALLAVLTYHYYQFTTRSNGASQGGR